MPIEEEPLDPGEKYGDEYGQWVAKKRKLKSLQEER